MEWIYLDNNATTMPAPEVTEAMGEMNQTTWANPSSVHRFGQMVKQRIELARTQLARLIGARPHEITFTSGGTEANNLAIQGLLGPQFEKASTLITTVVEHSAVHGPADYAEKLGHRVVKLGVDVDGLIDADDLKAAIGVAVSGNEAPLTVLVSVQWANNETGSIQDMKAITEAVQAARDEADERGVKTKIILHADATQAVGKLNVDLKELPLDMMTLAAHKFHGPKGVGALWVRTGIRLQAQQKGGPQERERRAGTENSVGIMGIGVAAELARSFVESSEEVEKIRGMRDWFEQRLVEELVTDDVKPEVVINCKNAERLWNTTNIAFRGIEAEAILVGLSEKGVCASAGSACSSGSLEPSPVLMAMGIPEPLAHGSVRFSLSRYTTETELKKAVGIVVDVVSRLQKTMPI
ncbi:cysteine desulfurase [Planctomycetota bacterium]|nr:cysteine desulfurase [Planctomycetota bacterium]